MNTTLTTHALLNRIRQFWNYMNAGPHQEWGRVSLCALAPMSAGALRQNQEAERLRAAW